MATVAKKQSVSTEIVLGQAANNFKKALGELRTAVSGCEGLEEKLENLQIEIAAKEDKIKELETQYSEKKRQAEVDLKLSIQASEESTVARVLADQGMIGISKEEVTKLSSELQTLKTNFDDQLKKETQKAYSQANGDYKSRESLLEAEYRAKEAGNVARISALEEKVVFLEKQNADLLAQLSAERQAGIERSKATPTVNVTSGAGK